MELAQARFNRKANTVAIAFLVVALIAAFIRFYKMCN